MPPYRKFDLPSLGPTEAGQPLCFFVGRLAAAEGAMLLGVLLIPYYQVFVLAMTLACMVTYFPHLIKAPNPVDGSKKP